jgi:hypothetical protein
MIQELGCHHTFSGLSTQLVRARYPPKICATDLEELSGCLAKQFDQGGIIHATGGRFGKSQQEPLKGLVETFNECGWVTLHAEDD